MAEATPAKSEEIKIPEKLGACADLLYTTIQKRYALQKQVKALEELETRLEEKIIKELPKSESTGVAGKKARVAIKTKDVPQVEDWPSLYAYITKTKSFDLLQKRLATGAVGERWEAKKTIPGVKKFTAISVSCTKV